MKQLIALLKAIMSQDMNLFKYKTKSNSSYATKVIMPLTLAIIFMCAIGTYFYIFATELSKINLTYIMLTFAMIVPCLFTLIEGIYKTQGILFETKDNNLLFALPIKKSRIIFARLFKLYVFQYLYNLLFILPAYIIYIYFEHPALSFYIISFIMTFLLPIIPTVIACFLGFIVKNISVKFKSKKIIQTSFTMIIFLGIFYLSFNTDRIIDNLLNNANDINDIISKIYYPVGEYIRLIQKFDIFDLLKLLLINIIPLILFVIITSKHYFTMISKSSENGSSRNIVSKRKSKNIKVETKNKMSALISKELKRYFSSTVYMTNTLIGLVIMIIGTIAICVNLNGTFNMITEGEELGVDINQILELMPKIFFGLVVFMSSMTSITSSSISIEGKSFNITKSLPVNPEEVLLSKVLSSNLITIPVILLCDIIFFISFEVQIFDIVAILIISLVMPTLTAIIGLFANLKYPKMNATSDTEVVKQSASSMISVLGGMLISIFLIGILVFASNIININIAIVIELIIICIITISLWNILKKYGNKRFKEIII